MSGANRSTSASNCGCGRAAGTIDNSNTTLAQRNHQLLCALDVDRLDAHAANLSRHGQFSIVPSQTCRRRGCCLFRRAARALRTQQFGDTERLRPRSSESE
jgi:hypothetical protein